MHRYETVGCFVRFVSYLRMKTRGFELRTGVCAPVLPVYLLTLKLYLFRNETKQRVDTVNP